MSTTPETINGLDLDALAAEVQPIEPYVFRFAGRTWSARHPHDVDWKIVAAMDERDQRDVLQAYLGDEQYAEFVQHDLPLALTNALVDDINKHHAAVPLGEGVASPRS